MKKATEVIHGKRILGDRSTRALSVPIYQSAVFTFENAEHGAALVAGWLVVTKNLIGTSQNIGMGT